jgi:hypothetical protein
MSFLFKNERRDYMQWDSNVHIYDSYLDYLTPEERHKVYLTTDGITVNTGEYIVSFYQKNKSNYELAQIIKSILKNERIYD